MERILLPTADGSHTISIPSLDVTYHSTHGAIQESMHVFIEAGLNHFINAGAEHIDILEIGFGTGLNPLLTLLNAGKISVRYEGLEPYPLEPALTVHLNYCQLLGRPDLAGIFETLHASDWEKEVRLTEKFTLLKQPIKLSDFIPEKHFDIIYFDAFAPLVQPELWSAEVFEKLFSCLRENGILVTYCSKVIVRKAMLAAGFTVEKIPGPKGKREILRARKPPVI